MPHGFNKNHWTLSCDGFENGETDRERENKREKLIPPKTFWLTTKCKNHFHILWQTTDSERKDGEQFQQHSCSKQMRHCVFPMCAGPSPDLSRAPWPLKCEKELGHLSFSFPLQPTQTLLESERLYLTHWLFFYPRTAWDSKDCRSAALETCVVNTI